MVAGPVMSEAELVGLAQSGDRAAMERLILRHQRLIHDQVHRLNLPPDFDYDDFAQAGLVALWRAILKWNTADGAKLATYCWQSVRNSLLRELGTQDRQKRFGSGVGGSLSDDEDHFDLEAVPDMRSERVAPPSLDLSELSPVGRRVVEMHFGLDGNPLTWGEIASRLGLTVPQAKGVLERSLESL